MACCTLNIPAIAGNRCSFATPPLISNPPAPSTEEIYPQSLNSLKFPLVGRLILAEGEEPPTIKDLCDGLQYCWKPTSTWRLISLPTGYFTLQFSSFRDHIKISDMASAPLKRGTMRVLSKFAPEFRAYKDLTPEGPSITSIRWRLPQPYWIKVNTDGSARGCDGGRSSSSCGGVFRDYQGTVVGCFSLKLGLGFALEAELRACILALDIAHARGWNKIWLESDSTQVVELLASRSSVVPEKLKRSWKRVLGYLEGIEFRVSHIYREGNRVADALADPNAECGWWPHATPAISELVHEDAVGYFNTRIHA